jgi:hypothetical protein
MDLIRKKNPLYFYEYSAVNRVHLKLLQFDLILPGTTQETLRSRKSPKYLLLKCYFHTVTDTAISRKKNLYFF